MMNIDEFYLCDDGRTNMEDQDIEIVEEPGTEVLNDTEQTERPHPNYPTQTVLTIRAIVGAYVLYLAYQIITSGDVISIPMWIGVAVFLIAGTGLVAISVKHLICGEYEGGKKDV